MGFRNGAYAKIWEVTGVSDTNTKLRISISRKDNRSGEYVNDFSGFVNAIGTAAAAKALRLKKGDRIKLGDVDVSNKYDKEKQVTYTNCKIFSFELCNGHGESRPDPDDPQPAVDEFDEEDDKKLPF